MSKFDDLQNDVKSTPGLGKSMAKCSALAGAGYAYYKGKKKV